MFLGNRTFHEANRWRYEYPSRLREREDKYQNPTYEQVCNDNTGFAETVEVSYDPRQADLKLLIELFFKTIDPTSINRQGNDIGSQYRTGIYYTNTDDLPIIKETVEALAKNYTKPIVVEIQPLSNFYPAEDYHQDYLDKHPDGYCHISPDLFDFARKANKGKASNKPVSQRNSRNRMIRHCALNSPPSNMR